MTRAIEFIEREYQRQPKLARNRAGRRACPNSTSTGCSGAGPAHSQAVPGRSHEPRGWRLRCAAEPSVLDAAHSVGLSGGGRLHDLTVTLEAMTPGEIRAGGEGVTIRHGIANTPFGTAFIAETPRGLCRLAFIDGRGDANELQRCGDQWPKAQIRARRRARYDFGRNHLGSQNCNVAAGRVRHQLPGAGLARPARTRCHGETVTYSALARKLGQAEWCACRW